MSVMLDPSLLAPRRLPATTAALSALEMMGVPIFVPRSFYELAIERRLEARDAAALFGQPRHELVAVDAGSNGRGRHLRPDYAERVAEWLRGYDYVYPFQTRRHEEVPSVAIDVRSPIQRSILLEEWTFLQTSSLIASRLRRPFTAFIRGGAVSIELGRRSLQWLEERTLKIEHEARRDLETIDHLRAAAKWFAAGGPATTSLTEALFGVEVPGVAEYLSPLFLLIDP